jgi:hypothetical protein
MKDDMAIDALKIISFINHALFLKIMAMYCVLYIHFALAKLRV